MDFQFKGVATDVLPAMGFESYLDSKQQILECVSFQDFCKPQIPQNLREISRRFFIPLDELFRQCFIRRVIFLSYKFGTRVAQQLERTTNYRQGVVRRE